MTKILCVGMGGVGVIASYTLQQKDNVEVTAVIRSDYDTVTTSGYTISSIDYGGRRENGDPDEASHAVVGFRPQHIYKSLAGVDNGPFDYIIVTTKVLPAASNNVWDEIAAHQRLLKPGKNTSVVLVQNGFGIDAAWSRLKDDVNLISGVSYISSVNTKGTITQFGHDDVTFGLFDARGSPEALAALQTFLDLYSNGINSVRIDHNVRFTRWRKLLYNGSFNTVCCLTDMDCGKVFEMKPQGIVDAVFRPLMSEIVTVANADLRRFDYGEYTQYLEQAHIDKIIDFTEADDAKQNYQPSMLVDSRHHRPIELEAIVGSMLAVYREIHGNTDGIPYLTFLYHLLSMVQHRLKTT